MLLFYSRELVETAVGGGKKKKKKNERKKKKREIQTIS